MEFDVVVIGAGPAGLSAAIYLARANLKVLVLDNPKEGALKKAEVIENYFGIESISGKELIKIGRKQAEKFGAVIKDEPAISIKPGPLGKGYIVETAEGEYKAKGLIIATGAKRVKPKIKNLEKFEGKGVSYCVVCDAFFFRNKKVGIVGSKDYAAKETIELLSYTKDITLFTNGDKIEISENLFEKLKENNIKIVETPIKELFGNEKLEGVILENGEKIELDGLFIAVGTGGAEDFARMLGIMIENGLIKVDKNQSTGVPFVYACGDCASEDKQVAIAVGDGARAALNLIKELKGIKKVADYH